jgi:5-methyltetrahydropteroyltriglutamate--homocysteine methyltransferase
MARTAVLGFPRIGPDRELKHALEAFWVGKITEAELDSAGCDLRALHIRAGLDRDIDVLPVGDFTLYDHVLDTAELVGITAERHRDSDTKALSRYFLACRGADGIAPLEMTKWFDTNYHYLVPELSSDQGFELSAPSLAKWTAHLREAQMLGSTGPRPVLVGPFSLLALSKGVPDPLALLPALTEVYRQLVAALAQAGAGELQLDEPCLVLDQTPEALDAFSQAYAALLAEAPLDVCLATYFGGLDDAVLARVAQLSIAELHVDLVRAPQQLDAVLKAIGAGTRLSAGVIDGRNVWATDVDRSLELLDRIVSAIGSERLTIAPSCSLLHVPYDAGRELELDDELRSWLAFAYEKLDELTLLARAVELEPSERGELLAPARARAASRRSSERIRDPAVRTRTAGLTAADYERAMPRGERLALQAERLQLGELPTPTIGSFPQSQIKQAIDEQELLGLDVFVHGEPERNDMVEYFGEQLVGFAFSQFGWVQSYGSRAVKPPILYGDVSRPAAMTVDWWRFAQSLTAKPVKGMLTGPVTILQWSFVRDDQPRADTCLQIALAVHDEVRDLEAAGAKIIQIDEAALREGLPLRRADQPEYVRWAIDCFRLTAAGVRAETQIHTHMCYSEFTDMLEPIVRLDADVISIEASRSGMSLLEAFGNLDYPGQIGPGVYDIHSPRVPSADEMESLLELAEERIPRTQLWVNPDCGLKTRAWPETLASLANLVEAAQRRRSAAAVGTRHD